MNLLEIEELKVQFHKDMAYTEVVRGVDFRVREGEIIGIVGESGSGKSSAMRAVMGLLDRSAEVSCRRYSFLGEERSLPLTHVPEGMAMIFQDPASCLNPTMKIGHQIAEAVMIHEKKGRREAENTALELLDMTGVRSPEKRMRQYPFELSGGMCQRVVIAMALACKPRLLIADEPTTALDVIVQGQILTLLKRIAEETKTAVVLISHDLGVIASMCSRMYVMKDGLFVEEGSAEQIFDAPSDPYTQKLIDTAKKRAGHVPVRMPEEGETLLKLKGITKIYREKGSIPFLHASKRISGDKTWRNDGVADVSLELREGETFGLVGESGSGKSTLAGIITGQKRADRGDFWYKGRRADLMQEKERLRWLREIQMVFQDPDGSLNPKLTAGQALTEALRADEQQKNWQQKNWQRVAEMLELVGLSPSDADKYPHQLSGGEKQRVGIARALICRPRVIVCDEAAASLDLSIQEQILRLLRKIQKETGTACIFISHDIQMIRQISGRIGVMYRGRMVESGDTDAVGSDPWHPYTKLLLESVPVPDPGRAGRRKYAPPREWKENTAGGCPYAFRCGYRLERCITEMPRAYGFGSREVACFLYSEEHRKNASGEYMTSQI